MNTPSLRSHSGWFYLIFAVSGFAGLIYESVWTRYLKLFLGHAALAQMLVLVIFLFGLAAGSAIASRFSLRIRRPLLIYAAVEAIIAIAALGFHDIYLLITNWMLDVALPSLGDGTSADLLKWSIGTALILPQSILLGTTFPLMSAGLIRLYPQKPGGVVSMLYFTNSFGAALGVIVSSFVLIPTLGLPGTVITAGLLNFIVALLIWAMDRRLGPGAAPATTTETPISKTIFTPGRWNQLTTLLLAAAPVNRIGFSDL